MLEPFALIEVIEFRKKTSSVIAKGVNAGDTLRISVEFVIGGGKPKTTVSKYLGSGDIYNIANFQYIGATEGGNFYKVYTDDPNERGAVLFKSLYGKGFAKGHLEAIIKSSISNCFSYNLHLRRLGETLTEAIQPKVEFREDSENFFKDLKKVIEDLCSYTKEDCERFEDSQINYDWDQILSYRSEAEAHLFLEVFKAVSKACLNFGYSEEELGL